MDTRFENPKVAKLYKNVPSEPLSRLLQFRTQYPYKRATVHGTEWRYIDTGSGEQVLLALSGATCIAEMARLYIEHFAQRNRVISPDYPALDTMTGLVDGIAGILDREGISRAHVIGVSYGGFVAQAFVRRHPDRTASLIVIFRTIMGQALSPRLGRPFSPNLGHWFSPELGQYGVRGIPPSRAYFSLSDQREWEGRCPARGKEPWIFETC